MARNNYPEITRARILESATRLFMDDGWDKTTIQDIVDDVGDITRGAFYHHFKSKEDIIDAVTTHLFYENNPFEISHELSGLNGLERLKQVILLSFTSKPQLDLARSVPYMLKAPEFVARQVIESVEMVAPNILEFIVEGISDGSITAKYPKETTETFSMLVNVWINPVLFRVTREEFGIKINHFGLIMDGIGVPVIDDEVKKAFLSYYDAVQPADSMPR